MATFLYRLGKLAYRRWPAFLGAWLVLLVGMGVLAGAVSKPMVDKFSIPGIPSEQAQTMQQELFPGTKSAFETASAQLVIAAPAGHTLREAQYSTKVDALLREMAKVPQLPKEQRFVNPVTAADAQYDKAVSAAVKGGRPQDVAETNAKALLPLSPDSRVGLVPFTFDVSSPQDVEKATKDTVLELAKQASTDGLAVEVNGNGMAGFQEPGGSSELIGIAVAALVLILTFGSLVAAGMPIVTAMVGVGIGSLGVQVATGFIDIGTTTPILATMLGLAVGIDYTLFILSRYRAELHHTTDREEAVGRAVGTAGSAVVFAGLTVLIALCALSVVQIGFLTSMGLAAAGTVFVAVWIALTLLPAVLGLLKHRAFAIQLRKEKSDEGAVVNNGVRWAKLIGRAPAVFALLVVLVLGALAIPIRDIHLGLPNDTTAPSDTTRRKAADLVADSFGPGRAASMLIVVDAREAGSAQARQEAIGTVAKWAGGQNNVANAQVIAMNQAGTGAQILLTPKTGPSNIATDDLLQSLRDGEAGIEADSRTSVGVTGLTAIEADVSQKLQDALVPYLAVVVGLAFILLMLVFRSLLVPLTATLGFLLSVIATLGSTTAIFSDGAFGFFDKAPLVSFLPILMIGIVFGLAMDYQVFLVTRMREAYVHGESAREAVVDGFRHGARVVTAAACIMISVFAAFMLQGDSLIKSMGFALASAVFFDAFGVRMIVIPALMYLMGDAAWKLPKWLDRILPKVDVEGENLRRLVAAQAVPASAPADEQALEPVGASTATAAVASESDTMSAAATQPAPVTSAAPAEPGAANADRQPGLVRYPFPLRPGLQAILEVPESMTDDEAHRLTSFIATLPLARTESNPLPTERTAAPTTGALEASSSAQGPVETGNGDRPSMLSRSALRDRHPGN